jgi:hypothetical protein
VIPAHVGPLPVEETLAALGPALLVVAGAVTARLRASISRRRSPGDRRA